MLPAGPLMKEHRTIEKMLALVARQGAAADRGELDAPFIFQAVDFIRAYADRTHHGKEEGILFRDLRGKPLSPEHRRVMDDLLEEHVYARKTVGILVAATGRHLDGDPEALREAANAMHELSLFYPAHIEKEDKHFFLPVMDYLTDSEKQAMLDEMAEFDRQMIHEHYREMVRVLEESSEATGL